MDLSPSGRVTESFEQRIHPTLLDPAGQKLAKPGRGRRVGIHVARDVIAAGTRCVDDGGELISVAVLPGVDDRDMRELHRDVGASAYLDRLLYCLDVPSGPDTCVRGVKGVIVMRHHRRERNDLVGIGVTGRWKGQPGGHPESALLHSCFQEALHVRKLIGGRRAIVQSTGRPAQRRVADQWAILMDTPCDRTVFV